MDFLDLLLLLFCHMHICVTRFLPKIQKKKFNCYPQNVDITNECTHINFINDEIYFNKNLYAERLWHVRDL